MKFTRLLPLVSSLSALALVAACARHSDGDASLKVSEQTMLQLAQKAVRETFGTQDLFKAEDMKLAAELEGAELRLNSEIGVVDGGSTRAVNADIVVLMKGQAEPIIASGVISSKDVQPLELKTADSKFKFSAKCVADDCANIVVQMSRLEDQTSVALTNQNGEQLRAAEPLKGSEEQAATLAPVVAAKPTNDAPPADETPEAKLARETEAARLAEEAKAPAIAPVVVKEEAPKAVSTAKLFMWFRVPLKNLKAQKAESKEEWRSRRATFELRWSTPTVAGGVTSGSILNVSGAQKARQNAGTVPAKTDAETEASKAEANKTEANKEEPAAKTPAATLPVLDTDKADVSGGKDPVLAPIGAAAPAPAAVVAPAKPAAAASAASTDIVVNGVKMTAERKALWDKAIADKAKEDAKAKANKEKADAKAKEDKAKADAKAKEKRLASVEAVLGARGN